MNNLTIAAMQWSALPNIDAVEPVGAADTMCLLEIRDVLRKHGKEDRFGVTLIHGHFDMSEDEILLETVDEESRTLTTKAIKEAEAGTKVATMFVLTDGVATMSWCRRYCLRTLLGHTNSHNVER